MNEFIGFIVVGAFVAGLVSGIATTYFGFKLGFRANIEARLQEDEVPDNKRLFVNHKEPAEFQLLEQQEKKDKIDDDDDDD